MKQCKLKIDNTESVPQAIHRSALLHLIGDNPSEDISSLPRIEVGAYLVCNELSRPLESEWRHIAPISVESNVTNSVCHRCRSAKSPTRQSRGSHSSSANSSPARLLRKLRISAASSTAFDPIVGRAFPRLYRVNRPSVAMRLDSDRGHRAGRISKTCGGVTAAKPGDCNRNAPPCERTKIVLVVRCGGRNSALRLCPAHWFAFARA